MASSLNHERDHIQRGSNFVDVVVTSRRWYPCGCSEVITHLVDQLLLTLCTLRFNAYNSAQNVVVTPHNFCLPSFNDLMVFHVQIGLSLRISAHR